MESIFVVLHVIVAISIVALVLLQQGKGADAGAAFGSGASQTVFGASGSGNFLTRATTVAAVLFFSTSMGLAIYAQQRTGADAGADALPDAPSAESAPQSSDQNNSDIPQVDDSASSTSQSGGAATDVPALPGDDQN